MKILHVVPSFGLGGMEKVMCAIINAIPGEMSQEILVLNGNCEALRWIENRNVRVLKFSRPSGNFPFFTALFQAIRYASPDLLMTYNWGATDAIWLGRLAGVSRILHSEHGFNVDEAESTNWKRNLIRHLVYRLSSRVIVVSRFLKHMMGSKFGIPGIRVPFILNGIDVNFFARNIYEREKTRIDLGVQEQEIVIGYFGRLDPVKNFSLFLDICAQTIERDRRFKVLLVGEGEERARIERYCVDRHLGEHFLLVGKQHNVLPYLQAMDIFLLTSFREQMPMSMLEAMSVGIPVVASAVGEIPAILLDRRAGFVFELEGGETPFVDALSSLADPRMRQQMGSQARNLVLNQYQEGHMIRQYLDLFDETMDRKGAFTHINPPSGLIVRMK